MNTQEIKWNRGARGEQHAFTASHGLHVAKTAEGYIWVVDRISAWPYSEAGRGTTRTLRAAKNQSEKVAAHEVAEASKLEIILDEMEQN